MPAPYPPGVLPEPAVLPSIVGHSALGRRLSKAKQSIQVQTHRDNGLPHIRVGSKVVYSNLRVREFFGWPLTGELCFDRDHPAW